MHMLRRTPGCGQAAFFTIKEVQVITKDLTSAQIVTTIVTGNTKQAISEIQAVFSDKNKS
ncbi:hypothetical protein D3C76_1734110 [compost metagenome]